MNAQDLGLDFDIAEVGSYGEFVAVPKRHFDGDQQFPRKTLPAGSPPILPSWEEELEDYLTCVEKVPIHDVTSSQKFWPRETCPDSLFFTDVTAVQTTIQVERNPTTGQLLGYKEEFIENSSEKKNSLSLKRPPGPASQDVRGSSTNFPFLPGGMEDVDQILRKDKDTFLDFDQDLLSVAPGFLEGMSFDDKQQSQNSQSNFVNLADIMCTDDLDEFDFADEEIKIEQEDMQTSGVIEAPELQRSQSLENLVKIESAGVLQEETIQPSVQKKEDWAIEVDINTPVEDFYRRVPDMAYKWPFELDIFQKQAILHLENHESVFVAAHTSAGKTVVAEYAIALSLKHMTRTIYTSPIKALSNQKFREFKQTFGEVGLITGDVQLNQNAACLIMTTEILRSMLYNGSDVIRDLEWVIFDEVHYINDAERGVVWEEVLIMLPQHVNIILLSATVPNTLEFADWIGRTKKKKIYVISTLKRPVPLEHFLYTGTSGKTSNELFMIVDHKKAFLTNGYSKALEAKKERSGKAAQGFGPKGTRGGNPHQDKNIWISVIDMLKKKDKLPVVAFTFSKRKIDENAQNLQAKDLTTQSEKSEIHIFFHNAIRRLKPPDQKLPQVLQMESLLKNGIGVHHSGILPILKEVVEMLFQRALVKILFATETFAMGVNMPARTVVFDSIRKYVGSNFRDLLPGEYIQMAGRAGRRGLDTTGTVIILCKGDVPEMSDLHKMMLGKPTKLESQFRLTYSMILNLLRVEQLRVEDMMKRSFSEFHQQKDINKHKVTIDQLHTKISQIHAIECYMCSIDLEQYYETCRDYQCLKRKLQEVVLSHPAAIKAMTAGRLVVISDSSHRNHLGVVLDSKMGSNNERIFNCFVISEQDKPVKLNTTDKLDDLDVTPIINTDLNLPEGPCWQGVVQVKSSDIILVTVKTIRVDSVKIMDDIRKRQMPRFKDDPPGKSVSVATQELLRMIETNIHGLPGLDPVKDLHLRDMELVEQFRSLQLIEEDFSKYQCIHCPHFSDHFEEHKRNTKLKDEYKRLKFLLSDESLSLLPEYQQRVQVLKSMNYIDENNAVQLKGRVACEISNHEIMITELVFENILTELHPTEIAAVLSCVVFEQKNCSKPNLSPELERGKESILSIARKISKLQRDFGMNLTGDYEDEFKFGLMEVVFEWARGMPFADITNLTDVQEGIIVRCIQRLNETLRDVRNAARIIGDPVLYRKMEESSSMIKRDIVFAASLYTQ